LKIEILKFGGNVMEGLNVLGERVRDLRIEKKLNQAELSRRIEQETGVKVSPATISDIENLDITANKGGVPGADKILAIARYFDVPTDWLLGIPRATRSRNISIQAAAKKYGLEERTLQNLFEWSMAANENEDGVIEFEFPFFTNRKRRMVVNALCSNENGHTVLDFIGSFLFDELADDVTAMVKTPFPSPWPKTQLTVRKEVFAELNINLANKYLARLKADLLPAIEKQRAETDLIMEQRKDEGKRKLAEAERMLDEHIARKNGGITDGN